MPDYRPENATLIFAIIGVLMLVLATALSMGWL
jgi:hypothetical protein